MADTANAMNKLAQQLVLALQQAGAITDAAPPNPATPVAAASHCSAGACSSSYMQARPFLQCLVINRKIYHCLSRIYLSKCSFDAGIQRIKEFLTSVHAIIKVSAALCQCSFLVLFNVITNDPNGCTELRYCEVPSVATVSLLMHNQIPKFAAMCSLNSNSGLSFPCSIIQAWIDSKRVIH